MTITIGFWIIPAIITAFFLFWPMPKSSAGMFGNMGAVISSLFRIIGLLFVWMAYFAIMYFLK